MYKYNYEHVEESFFFRFSGQYVGFHPATKREGKVFSSAHHDVLLNVISYVTSCRWNLAEIIVIEIRYQRLMLETIT